MTVRPLHELVGVTERDIDWVSSTLGLCLDDARATFLKDLTACGVAACPGSGKTTMVVAKLALLARRWPFVGRGICVLSHTNVARNEVRLRLSKSGSGATMLRHPHFVGTIHAFINKTLSSPLLASRGYPTLTIDDETAQRVRLALLKQQRNGWSALNYLEKLGHSIAAVRLRNEHFEIEMKGGKDFPASQTTNSYVAVRDALKSSAHRGYFCHDEMFIWARELLGARPEVGAAISRRFPLVIIDEMQDTSRDQLALLESLFSSDLGSVLQHVGDANQRILSDAEAVTSHRATHVIANSHRFGGSIADVASPFAVEPVPGGLRGVGPDSLPPVAFVFPNDDARGVIEAYGRYALTRFDSGELGTGPVFALAGVHKKTETEREPSKYPRSLVDYCIEYRAQTPGTSRFVVDRIRDAQSLCADTREQNESVAIVARAIMQLVARAGAPERIRQSPQAHRVLRSALCDSARRTYEALIADILRRPFSIDEDRWSSWRKEIVTVVNSLAANGLRQEDVALEWRPHSSSLSQTTRVVSSTERSIAIQMGSIHGVKGQTHLATLLLSSYYYGHSSEKILPWLLGLKCGPAGGKRQLDVLRQTYVALTRPARLVGVALRQSAVDQHNGAVELLEARGWDVVHV